MTTKLTGLIKDFTSPVSKTLTLEEYIDLLKTDSSVYANAASRMLKAIGEPTIVDTSKDYKLGRIFSNRMIKTYSTFENFYGMETVIESIVSYFKHASQGLEEKKQILYLLGPVGSAKSSLAEKLKQLMETYPIYVLTINGELSPVYESPLGLFNKARADELNVPEHVLTELLSPWAIKRLRNTEKPAIITVSILNPSKLNQIGITKTEPGDENNQDTTCLVGKTDIRQLGKFSQNDSDSYSYSGGLCLANQGLLEFVEMFKAPIKVLHPLLTATQEGNYNPSEPGFGSIPFDGIILAHSNEAEWEKFKTNKNNEAFLDRICLVKVPYVLRYTEELKIYEKLIKNSDLRNAVCAPRTLELLAQFSVFSRMKEHTNTKPYLKLKCYNGDNIKDEDPKTISFEEYKDMAGQDEGMTGISTRFAFKVLAETFNFDSSEIAANVIHLFYVLLKTIEKSQFPKEIEEKYKAFLINELEERYRMDLEKEIQSAYLDSYDDYGQNLFERYIKMADYWLREEDFRDADTGELFDKGVLDKELNKIEGPAGVYNVKDFRHDIVNFVNRSRAHDSGKMPNWKSYDKLKTVIEKNMFKNTESLLPIISFNTKDSKENKEKHKDFLQRMISKGYTEKQVKLHVEWFMRKMRS